MSKLLVQCPYCSKWIPDTDLTCFECVEKYKIDNEFYNLIIAVGVIESTSDYEHLKARKEHIELLIASLQKVVDRL
jgi:hypothetical protein